MKAIPSRSRALIRASFNAVWTAIGCALSLATSDTGSRRKASAPCCAGEPALPCRGECRQRIHVCGRGKVRIGRSGRGAHTWFCLRTTFERILRDEVTTAAQVSSAEDSRARTVKCRRMACRRGEGNGNRRGRLIGALG